MKNRNQNQKSETTIIRNAKLFPFFDKIYLSFRNAFTAAASVLFLISILSGHVSNPLKFAAYFLGMAAYIFEYLHLTKDLREKIPHDELFMVYCFAPLYLLMGISYLLH